jgi:VanZ family protein
MSTSGLREKPKQTIRVIALIAAILWAGLIFFLSSRSGTNYPSHPEFLNVVAHFCLYLVFSIFLTVALNNQKRALWKTALIALIITSLYGVSDEIHQLPLFVENRSSDPLDWLTDTVGGLLGATLTIWFISARKVRLSRARDKERRRG